MIFDLRWFFKVIGHIYDSMMKNVPLSVMDVRYVLTCFTLLSNIFLGFSNLLAELFVLNL